MSREIGGALAAWMGSTDTGASSSFMAIFLSSGVMPERRAFPYDPSDFGRCERMLRRVPHLRERLPQMSDAGHVWKALVDRWGEIVATMEAEIPGCFNSAPTYGRAPRTYDILLACRGKSPSLRWIKSHEVARLCGNTSQWVYARVKDGSFTPVAHHPYLFDEAEICRWLGHADGYPTPAPVTR